LNTSSAAWAKAEKEKSASKPIYKYESKKAIFIGTLKQKKPVNQVSFGCSGCQHFHIPDKSIKKTKKT